MFLLIYLSGCVLMFIYCLAYLFYRREFWLSDLVVIPIACLFSWLGVAVIMLVLIDNGIHMLMDKRKTNKKYHLRD